MQDDRQLISNILKGDIRAFKLLVVQHEKIIVGMISRLVKDKEDIKDVCQDAFIKIHKSLPSFKFQSKLSTWIARIAYTTAVDHIKRSSKISDQFDNDFEEIENYHSTEENPESLMSKKNTSEFIQQAIMELPVHYRTIITLYHLSEFSYSEIEEITGMPEGTVKNYLFRARKLLKEKLGDYLN